MSLVMGIDLGTSSAKTVLMDETGNLVSMPSAAYPLLTPHAGWAEQKPDDWWNALCDTSRQVIGELKTRHLAYSVHDIKGVSLSGQMNSAILVGRRGEICTLACDSSRCFRSRRADNGDAGGFRYRCGDNCRGRRRFVFGL